MNFKVALAQACGNTFLIVDFIENESSLSDDVVEHIHQLLLKKDRDDALLIFKQIIFGSTLYLHMKVLGRDKKFGAFCGNGARAVGAYVKEKYPEYQQVYVVSNINTYAITWDESRITVDNFQSQFLRTNQFLDQSRLAEFSEEKGISYISIAGESKIIKFFFVLTDEPHLVTFDELTKFEFQTFSEHLNRMTLFPYGINVNVVQIIERDRIHVVTYERGVQGITKACGTGAMSAARLAYALGNIASEVTCEFKGGSVSIILDMFKGAMTGAAYIE